MSKDCREWKYDHHKKIEKAERAIDVDEDDVVLCSLMSDCKKECKNKKVWFMEDLKQPSEAGMMWMIEDDTFFWFMENTWIRDSGASCHITNDDTRLYSITNIDNLSKVPLVLCPLRKRGSYESRYAKLMGLNGSIHYGSWTFSPRQVQTYYLCHANSCRETRLWVTSETTLWSILQQAISSLIAKLRLMTVELQESIFYAKPMMRGLYMLLPYTREISTSFTLN